MRERDYLRDDVRGILEEILPDRTPVAAITTESIRALAKDVATAVGNTAQKECEETGPICHVRKDIEAMRAKVAGIELEQTKMFAVLGFWKWALPIAVTIAIFLGGIVERRIMAGAHPVHPAQVQK